MNYRETITALFQILADCNLGDSDLRQEWQTADDASQRAGAYGHIRSAIVALAGQEIVEDWEEYGELTIELANRLPREERVSKAEIQYFGSPAECFRARKIQAERKRAAKLAKLAAQITAKAALLSADLDLQIVTHTAKPDANPDYLAALRTLRESIDSVKRFH